ncbi:MAG: WG repeat-containing protein [Flavobacteriales bacterium]|nr:WG repeat-containing protein [Flavobacteriales bacterium]
MRNTLIIGVLMCFLVSSQNLKDKYSYSKRISKGCKMVLKNNAFGIIDKEGELILPIGYEDIDVFSKKGYVIIIKDKKSGLYSLIDKKIIIPTEYGDIEKIKNGFRAYGRNYQVVEFSLGGEITKTCTSICASGI